jgi:hypothetical protein
VFLSGSPIAAGVGVGFYAMKTESSFRLQVLSTLAVDETQLLDLDPVLGYWLPMD